MEAAAEEAERFVRGRWRREADTGSVPRGVKACVGGGVNQSVCGVRTGVWRAVLQIAERARIESSLDPGWGRSFQRLVSLPFLRSLFYGYVFTLLVGGVLHVSCVSKAGLGPWTKGGPVQR